MDDPTLDEPRRRRLQAERQRLADLLREAEATVAANRATRARAADLLARCRRPRGGQGPAADPVVPATEHADDVGPTTTRSRPTTAPGTTPSPGP